MHGELLHFCIGKGPGGLVGERFVKLSFEQEYALEEGVRFDDPDKALLLWPVLGAFLLHLSCRFDDFITF